MLSAQDSCLQGKLCGIYRKLSNKKNKNILQHTNKLVLKTNLKNLSKTKNISNHKEIHKLKIISKINLKNKLTRNS